MTNLLLWGPNAPVDHSWLEVRDVHKGPLRIWKPHKGTLFCDIDGTVADLTHRRKFLLTKPKDYPAFEKALPFDKPILPIIDAVRSLYDAGWTVVMCSGRRETQRDATVTWLEQKAVPWHALYMRAQFEYNPDGSFKRTRKGEPQPDYRPDYIIKEELLASARSDGYDPDIVFDDRNQVVEMWRRNGIPCVQVAEGDF